MFGGVPLRVKGSFTEIGGGSCGNGNGGVFDRGGCCRGAPVGLRISRGSFHEAIFADSVGDAGGVDPGDGFRGGGGCDFDGAAVFSRGAGGMV